MKDTPKSRRCPFLDEGPRIVSDEVHEKRDAPEVDKDYKDPRTTLPPNPKRNSPGFILVGHCSKNDTLLEQEDEKPWDRNAQDNRPDRRKEKIPLGILLVPRPCLLLTGSWLGMQHAWASEKKRGEESTSYHGS